MPRYRKKPVEIEAVLWTGRNTDQVLEFGPGVVAYSELSPRWHGVHLNIHTLEGVMVAMPGDYIIKGIKGEFYPCKPDIFEETYEPVG